MEMKARNRYRKSVSWKVLIILTLMVCGIMLSLSYAQSSMGSAFNLNSPASFPVDI